MVRPSLAKTTDSSCSTASTAAGETLAGSAPSTRTWLVIEYAPSWGANALDALPAGLGAHITDASASTPLRIVLARRPGAPHDRSESLVRRVWIGHTDPQRAQLSGGQEIDLRHLLDWDFSAIAQGELPALDSISDPLHLLCTNGGRDACCATLARPLLRSLPALPTLWECSHLGGHRFAPTMLTLPSGYLHGRLTARATTDQIVASREGCVLLHGLRGRSWLSPPAQVAEIAVRTAADVHGVEDLRVDDPAIDDRALADAINPGTGAESDRDDAVSIWVQHRDGRRWSVEVVRRVEGAVRPLSCGAGSEPLQTWHATGLRLIST